jgi:hypothetical protein
MRKTARLGKGLALLLGEDPKSPGLHKILRHEKSNVATKRGHGKKSITGPKVHTIKLRVTQHVKDLLDEWSSLTGRSISELLHAGIKKLPSEDYRIWNSRNDHDDFSKII